MTALNKDYIFIGFLDDGYLVVIDISGELAAHESSIC